MAIAKTKFSGPPSTTDHPISGLSVPKPITFKRGETINPYRTEKQGPTPTNQQEQQQAMDSQTTTMNSQQYQLQQQQQNQPHHDIQLDPMHPPIVRLTEQSAEGDGRFLKARLRDPNIMRVVRLFLAYMKDQPETVCIDGMTITSIRVLLASEGLPTDPAHLLRIFNAVHQEYGVSPAEAASDLSSYRQYLKSERTNRLQQLRESSNKFYSPLPERNFMK